MLKSSLLEIIRTFTKQELIKFEDFVRSPYFNKKENVLKLFLEIKKQAPGLNHEELEKEKVWSRLFPGQKYNYGIMKNLIHDLGKLCESFLSEEVYKTNEMQRTLDLLSSVFPRNINNIFSNKIESAQKTFNKNFETGNYDFAGDFYEKFRDIYDLKSNFLHHNTPHLKKSDELKYVSEYQVFGFLIKCFNTFHKVMVSNINQNYQPEKNIVFLFLRDLDSNSILKDVLKYAGTYSVKNYPILKCYYSMYKALITNDTKEYFYQFKNDLSEYSSGFSNDEVKGLYNTLLTCLTNLKITTNDFYNEYFSIIQLGAKNKVMLNKDGTITFQNFFSTVNVSCGAKETEYAEDFINNYKDKLPPDIRENAYVYSMAQLNFTRKNFEKSLEFLIRIKNEPVILKYSIKNLQLSIYYELNDREAFEYSFDSIKHFIRKNKLTNESRVITQAQYCNYIKSLFKLRESFDAFELISLKKEILKNKVINKIWLLEKIEELENS